MYSLVLVGCAGPLEISNPPSIGINFWRVGSFQLSLSEEGEFVNIFDTVLKQMFICLEGEFICFSQQILVKLTEDPSSLALNWVMFILVMLTFLSGVIHWTVLISYVVC